MINVFTDLAVCVKPYMHWSMAACTIQFYHLFVLPPAVAADDRLLTGLSAIVCYCLPAIHAPV
jgi:hypothetical protein